jgi:hypothetical protein
MDSRKTGPGDGDERTTENVVRLPRDWLGPRDELVPMGSRARTAETLDDASVESLPPTAASFWDEDSGSLQAAMQAPADPAGGQCEPADALPSARRPRARRLYRGLARPRLPRSLTRAAGFPRGRSTAAVAGLLTASVVVILAVIGQTEGGTSNVPTKTASSSESAPIVTATGVNRARLKAQTSVVTETRTEPRTHHGRRSRVHSHRAHSTAVRHHGTTRSAPRPTQTTSQPVVETPTPTVAPTTPTTPTPSPPSSGRTSSSPPASVDRSASSSSQHQPAFGPNGSLGPGSSPDS